MMSAMSPKPTTEVPTCCGLLKGNINSAVDFREKQGFDGKESNYKRTYDKDMLPPTQTRLRGESHTDKLKILVQIALVCS